MPQYSYDPSKICDEGVDRMRFELGDTCVDGGYRTCALCDEEYAAVIGTKANWKRAKYKCLEAIAAKMAYEVDYSVSEMSMSMSQRYERWRQMYLEMKSELKCSDFATGGTSSSLPFSLGQSGSHYFTFGMHDNPKAWTGEKS